MKNIILVGFMGTGKTEVSKILAATLQRQRLCTDDMIEWKVGKPIHRIFEEDGEDYFRKVEADIVAVVARDKNAIIDAGGGVVINENNVRRLKEHGVVICLYARPQVIVERTSGYSHRPLLNVDDPVSKIRELLDKRKQYYDRADYTIDTSDLTLQDIAEKIVHFAQEAESARRPHFAFT